ncbi:MAG: hypothetical protein KKB79_02150 [Nanoarchaeota archaeon]|nr:hypothetical protein [Nanoarchaeota archaeon]
MNKKGSEFNALGKAIIFVGLFFIGGILGSLSLPEFPGRFFISGLVFASFGMGLGNIIIHMFIGGRN